MQVYKIVFKEVQDIVNRYDPVGLIEGGAPDDEYYDQITKIVTILGSQIQTHSLSEAIINIFHSSFEDVKINVENCNRIASELVDLKTRLNF